MVAIPGASKPSAETAATKSHAASRTGRGRRTEPAPRGASRRRHGGHPDPSRCVRRVSRQRQPGGAAESRARTRPTPRARCGTIRGAMIDVGSVLLARYKLNARVGVGGMATVYDGEDLLLRRRVAVKIPLPFFCRGPGLRGALRERGARRRSPDAPESRRRVRRGRGRGNRFIVMEFVDGETLKDLIRREGPLPCPKTSCRSAPRWPTPSTPPTGGVWSTAT